MPTALITGASTGIGAEFARRYAEKGHDLVLVARTESNLRDLASELEGVHSIVATVIAMDLAASDAGARLFRDTEDRGIRVDVLVNNAGFATHGAVVDADPARYAAETQLNCGTLVDLSTRYLPGMVARGSGTVINVASTAAFQPLPLMAVYGATKAFVLSFSRALWEETRRTGVNVIAVCPGATDTPFFEVAGEAAAVGRLRTPQTVVDATFRALGRRRPSVVDGFSNALVARVATRLLSERAVIAIAARTMRPGAGADAMHSTSITV